jgi:hypothetical protein
MKRVTDLAYTAIQPSEVTRTRPTPSATGAHQRDGLVAPWLFGSSVSRAALCSSASLAAREATRRKCILISPAARAQTDHRPAMKRNGKPVEEAAEIGRI